MLCKPWTEQAGVWVQFCMKRLRTLKLFQIFSTEIKKSKTYSGWCPFKGLFNGTTLMQIQSGRTVPLKVTLVSMYFYSRIQKNLISIFIWFVFSMPCTFLSCDFFALSEYLLYLLSHTFPSVLLFRRKKTLTFFLVSRSFINSQNRE